MTTFKDLVVDELLIMVNDYEERAKRTSNLAEQCLHRTVAEVLKTVIEEGDIIEKQVV